MDRRSIHRGLVALTLVVGLMLAGVQPAAAAKEPGFRGPSFERLLTSVWGELESLFARIAARPEKPQTQDRGFGIDPNGNEIGIGEDGETQPGPNG